MLLIALLSLLLVGGANFYFSVQILRKIAATESKLSFFEIRWQVHKNLRKYCQLTRVQDGHVGTAFYGYWATVVLMLMVLMLIFSLALA